MTRNGDPSTTLSYGLGTVQSNPVTTDGTPPPACPFHPSHRPRNHRGHARKPQPAPNFIPGIAPRSGASLSQLVTRSVTPSPVRCAPFGQASWPARACLPPGSQRLWRSRAGPEDRFCEAVRNGLRVPLTLKGRPRKLRAAPEEKRAAEPPPIRALTIAALPGL
jgi:hypothetical protein